MLWRISWIYCSESFGTETTIWNEDFTNEEWRRYQEIGMAMI